MILRNSQLIFVVLIYLDVILTVSTKEKREPTMSECAAKGGECDETKGRPICGTDDQTYPTRCHLTRAQCSGHQVSLKYRGPCKACIDAREYALKHKIVGKSPPKFIPRCKADGTYAPVQCLGDSGCWCSDITGKPIENTSVRTGKPKCRGYNKANIRRSPARHLSLNRGRRSCTQIDRGLFNGNLIRVFQSEYIRIMGQHQKNNTKNGLLPSDKSVLEWKFSTLDTNGNQMLDKNEFRELKKAVKRAVKPRRCGRAFGKLCDIDNDDKLSRLEWSHCITKDGINRHPGIETKNTANGYNTPSVGNHHVLLNHQNHHKLHNMPQEDLDNSSDADDDENNQHLSDYDDSDDYDAEDIGEDDDNLNININTFGSSTNFPSIYFLRPKTEPVLRESESESDCLADQAVALEEQKHGGTVLYVPECTPDGRYQRVQCYRSTGYCWCVHEDTGKNIPGTSVKDKRPQCDAIYPISRPMKGCSEPRKTEFLKDLKEFLTIQIGLNSNSDININTTKWNSEDEKIATLSFVLLDKNKNKSWERKEWKTFRELVTASKTLRKCGKKMPRYCDVNSDKKITLPEWLNCLQAQRIEAETQKTFPKSESITTKPSKFTGPNPLESYLKD